MQRPGTTHRRGRPAAVRRPAPAVAGGLGFAVLCLVGILGAGCRPPKAKIEDPCSFLRPAEIQEMVGVPVEEGKIVSRRGTLTLGGSGVSAETSGGRMCQYMASGASGNMIAGGMVNVIIYPAAEYEKQRVATYKCGVCTPAGRCREVAVSPVAVPGVGESAFWFTPPPDTAEEQLRFACGATDHFAALDITHAIRIDVPFVREGMDVKSASIALARKALPRFPIPAPR